MIDEFEEMIDFTNVKKNIYLTKLHEIQLKEINNIEQEIDVIIGTAFQVFWPNFIKSTTYHQKSIQIDIKEDDRLEILNATLINKRQAFKKRIDKFKDFVVKKDDNQYYVGRLIRYQIADNEIQNQVKAFFFDCDDPIFQNKVKQIRYSLDQTAYFYSGQIVALTFESLTSKDLEIQSILNFQFEPEQIQEEIEHYQYNSQQRKDSIVMVIAAGPFEQNDKFGYKGLLSLIDKIKKKTISCDVLMLLGPLLDQSFQKNIDQFELEYQEFYELLLSAIIEELPKNIQLIIVNSTSEILSYYPVPQPPLDIQILQLQKKDNKKQKQDNLHFAGNPSIIEIDDLTIGIINEDIISELNSASEKIYCKDKEKLEIAMRQLIEQRTFVPLFPTKFPTDWTKIENLEFDSVPNVIITPSNFIQSAKKINETLFINPYHFYRANQYSILTYNGNNSLPVIQKLRVDFDKLQN